MDAKLKIVSAILNSGEEITFSHKGGRYNPKGRTIDGIQIVKDDNGTENKKFATIKLQDISQVEISEQRDGRTFAVFVAVTAVAVSLILLSQAKFGPSNLGNWGGGY